MTAKTPGRQSWLLLALALLGAGLTFSLGLWQLGRAAEKTALQLARTEQAQKPALDGQSLKVDLTLDERRAELLHRRMVLVGHWLHEKTIYLDNRQMLSLIHI